MKFIYLFFILFVQSKLGFFFKTNDLLDDEWKLYVHTYDKKYTNHDNHELKRRLIWESNVEKIDLHNQEHQKGKHSFQLKMNKFGDLTHDEFIKRNGFISPSGNVSHSLDNLRKKRLAPSYLDWRALGYVTQIKDQGECGSCWAFSAVASLEGQFKKKTNRLVTFSPQNLVDCARNGNFIDTLGTIQPIASGSINNFIYTANGCNGGNFDAAFQYFKYNSLQLAASYPYTGIVIYSNLLFNFLRFIQIKILFLNAQRNHFTCNKYLIKLDRHMQEQSNL